MKQITTSGKTYRLLESEVTNVTFVVSIVAFRAVGLIKWKSFRGEWEHEVSMILPMISIGRLVMFGFQPETGLHLCYWDRENEQNLSRP